MDTLKTVKSTRYRLVLDRLRFGSFMIGVLSMGFILFWYYILLKEFLPDHSIIESIRLKVAADKGALLFLFAGLFVFHQMYTSFRNAVYGEKFEFIKARGKVFRNEQLFFNFSDVENIQVREITDSDGDTTYRLSVIMKIGNKKFIDSTTSASDVYAIADDIADILEVSVISKV